MLTQKRVKELFNYDEESGVLSWRFLYHNSCGMSGHAGWLHRGYYKVSVDNRTYPATHLIWLFVYGHFPTLEIDHEVKGPENTSEIMITYLRRPAPESQQSLCIDA